MTNGFNPSGLKLCDRLFGRLVTSFLQFGDCELARIFFHYRI